MARYILARRVEGDGEGYVCVKCRGDVKLGRRSERIYVGDRRLEILCREGGGKQQQKNKGER